MVRLLALLIVLIVMAGVGGLEPTGLPRVRAAALALGFALIAAALAGELLERLRLPRVTGYLLFGLACGPSIGNLITRPMARELALINGLAVALIAFVAGLEMNVARLRPRLRAMLRLGGVTIAAVFLAFFVLFAVAWPWLAIAPEAGLPSRLAMAAVVAALVTSFSPTVTLAIIAESRAAGPLSDLTLAIVILADIALVFLFTASMQLVHWTVGASTDVGLVASLVWDIGGSLALGAAIGAIFALYLRYVGREQAIVLIVLCAVIVALGVRWHVEPVLSALAAGLVVENVAPPEGDAFRRAVERSALPILIIFFVAAGASLELDALARVGLLAVALSVARAAFIRTGTRLGARGAAPGEPAGLVWMGLVSQAGVTIGLAAIVAVEYPAWGATVQTLVVALVAIHQLAGPVLFRLALARAGEIGRANGARAAAR